VKEKKEFDKKVEEHEKATALEEKKAAKAAEKAQAKVVKEA